MAGDVADRVRPVAVDGSDEAVVTVGSQAPGPRPTRSRPMSSVRCPSECRTGSSADSSAIGPAPLLAEGATHRVAVDAAFDLDRRRVGADVDAAVLEAQRRGVTGERLEAAEQPGGTLHDRHRPVPSAPGDGELAADRPAAEDDQAAWYRAARVASQFVHGAASASPGSGHLG